MDAMTSNGVDTGLVVLDLLSDHAFARRRLHVHDVEAKIKGMHQLAHAFVGTPDTILQVLVDAAVDLCGAESAGISIERKQNAAKFYHWVATAGQYRRFLNAMLPCGSLCVPHCQFNAYCGGVVGGRACTKTRPFMIRFVKRCSF